MKQLANNWFIYILRAADGSFHTGITNDLERRIEQPNAGTASRYTRSRMAGHAGTSGKADDQERSIEA